MIGAYGLDDSIGQSPPEGVLVVFFADGRTENIFGPLEVGKIVNRIIQEKLLRAGLSVALPTFEASSGQLFHRFTACHMNDVSRLVRQLT